MNGLEREFSKISINLNSEIKKNPSDDIIIALAQLPPPLQVEHPRLIKKVKAQLKKSKKDPEKFSDALLSLWENADFLNPLLVDHLVNVCGSPCLQKQMAKYMSKLQNFRTSTYLCVYAEFQPPPKKLEKEKFKHLNITTNWENATLEDIEQFRQKMLQIMVSIIFAFYSSMLLQVQLFLSGWSPLVSQPASDNTSWLPKTSFFERAKSPELN